jgi:hypothetical protein
MQVYLSKRKGRLRWTASYTLSRARDNASGNGDNPEDYLNKDYNWGPSDFDRKHVIVGTWTYQIPFFREGKGVGRVLGGWEVSGIGRYQTGAPLTIMGDTSIGTRRADYLGGDPYLPDSQRFDPAPGIVRWFDPAVFAPAPEGRRGNSGRGQFRGPSLQVWDFSLRKTFAVAGDVRLQVQADLFNAFNQKNFRFSNQTPNFSSGGFGQLTAIAPPRNVQIGARVTF